MFLVALWLHLELKPDSLSDWLPLIVGSDRLKYQQSSIEPESYCAHENA